jgi:hypothetical protein
MISQKGLAPFLKGQLICKGYGAKVLTLMKLVFMSRVQRLWASAVFERLFSSVGSSLLWFVSLWKADP